MSVLDIAAQRSGGRTEDVLGAKVSAKLPMSTTYVIPYIPNTDTVFIKFYIVFVTLPGTLENILVKYTFFPSS